MTDRSGDDMTTREPVPSEPAPSEAELLLPWYATGRISAPDRALVDAALASDPLLRRSLDLIRADMDETIVSNERLPAPSPRVFDKLLAGIDAEPRRAPVLATTRKSIVGWLEAALLALSPRKLAYAGLAATALIAVQGAVITGLFIGGESGRFGTASAPITVPGTYVMLSFVPDARASEIAAFFRRYNAAVIDGPRANGFFKVRVGETTLSRTEIAGLVERMKAERNLIGFVAPAN